MLFLLKPVSYKRRKLNCLKGHLGHMFDQITKLEIEVFNENIIIIWLPFLISTRNVQKTQKNTPSGVAAPNRAPAS